MRKGIAFFLSTSFVIYDAAIDNSAEFAKQSTRNSNEWHRSEPNELDIFALNAQM
jgi:hypothetical protein